MATFEKTDSYHANYSSFSLGYDGINKQKKGKGSEIWKWRVKFLVGSPFGALILKTLYRPGVVRAPVPVGLFQFKKVAPFSAIEGNVCCQKMSALIRVYKTVTSETRLTTSVF